MFFLKSSSLFSLTLHIFSKNENTSCLFRCLTVDVFSMHHKLHPVGLFSLFSILTLTLIMISFLLNWGISLFSKMVLLVDVIERFSLECHPEYH